MIKDKILNHFYIIEGDVSDIDILSDHLSSERDIKIASNPDFYIKSYESFSIDDSRFLKDFFGTSSLSENKKVAVIYCDNMTTESQNALLKLAEEPALNQHLFILIPNTGLIIETLISRAQVIKSYKINDDKYHADDFLKMKLAERIAFVNKIITKKDKNKAKDLIDRIIVSLKKEKRIKELEEVYKSRSYINDRSCSIKLILEHISLILG
jgi:DNA polymerase III delta prime subunit